jgi:hypothetical protein
MMRGSIMPRMPQSGGWGWLDEHIRKNSTLLQIGLKLSKTGKRKTTSKSEFGAPEMATSATTRK